MIKPKNKSLIRKFCSLIEKNLLLTTKKITKFSINRLNQLSSEKDIRVCFFDLFPEHYQFSQSALEAVAKVQTVALIVCDKNHPAFRNRRGLTNIHVFFIDRQHLGELRRLRLPIMATPASHLQPSLFRPDLKIIHTYHSLVSMHKVYGDDAFDAYTHYFACGPHHAGEAKAIHEKRALPNAQVYHVGYPKLDALHEKVLANRTKKESATKTVVLAPSWHAENLLKNHGVAICQTILSLGYKVIIRPHPHLRDRDKVTMRDLQSLADHSDGRVLIEDPMQSYASFYEADLMISDWSGVAFEFAFACERPVLFIDTPQKINSVELAKLDAGVFEEDLRYSVGVIVPNVDEIAQGIRTIFATSTTDWRQRIIKARDKNIYNFGMSAEVGANLLLQLSATSTLLPADPPSA